MHPEFGKFTYPFCYVPHPMVREEASALINRIDATEELATLFSEGKMMGVLICEDDRGELKPLFGFSGLAKGKSMVEGFVPPIFDTQGLRPATSASDSRAIQNELFESYRVHNANGEELSIKEIFALKGLVPPGGTGDCAAPKLLEYAYRSALKPLAMGEFWYGESPRSEVRRSGCFYPSCTGKCGPLLSWMMKGLDVAPNPLDEGFLYEGEPRVVYEDPYIIVAHKPSGMLSVPGRVAAPSLLGWLKERYADVFSCHRLDMDTSGVMVFARSVQVQSAMEQQFASGEVKKTYLARLRAGAFRHAMKGTIALPLSADYYDRPRQIVDREHGKRAITEYEVLEKLPDGEIQIRFTPLTGRTHQLRVHAAHADGLGLPIKGDRLYGDATEGKLYLHAESITFRHPVDGTIRKFTV